MHEPTILSDGFPSHDDYALAQRCSTCGAPPGRMCNAPRKAAKAERFNRIREEVGRDRVGPEPSELLHLPRQDAGDRHRGRDIRNAPHPEDRIPGQRYDTLDKPVRRTRQSDPAHTRVRRDPADAGQSDPNLQYEEEIVWLEDPERFTFVRVLRTTAPYRQRGIRWSSLGIAGELVGYATLTKGAPSRQSGYFERRLFYIHPEERPEHPSYVGGLPHKAVDPRTVRPGIPGTPPGR